MRTTRNLDPNRLAAKAGAAAGLLRTLANENRLMILCNLIEGECSVGALGAAVGLSQSALSQHLAKLRADRLVATRREAQTIYYRLASAEATRVMQLLADIYCAHLRHGAASRDHAVESDDQAGRLSRQRRSHIPFTLRAQN
jgi:DNA-binding transcriptional ArsR family regulator